MTTDNGSQGDLSPTKRALLALKEMQVKLAALEKERSEPIAVIGIGCRFPGNADSPERFWKMLCDGRDAVTEVPADRWDLNAFYDADPDAPGKMYTRYGGFTDIDSFDTNFFEISPREVAGIDPQQRMMLEVSWAALENANQAPSRLFASDTGVFLGVSNCEHAAYRSYAADCSDIDAHYGTDNALSVVAGRIAFLLGLKGPCYCVDTACSSSLVAVHLACQSLRSRECDLAITGGVNSMISPQVTVMFCKARMLSSDGSCKTFDKDANGYVRGEGCGVVVLKRLSDAVDDGDHIYAVIRGTAINQDGRSSGLTVPNGPSQQAVIRKALKNGGIDPSQVTYIEAHGTGTPLGDPIEAGALSAVFGPGRAPDRPLWIGAVKTNIGHLEAAAGIAGLIKTALSLYHKEIPPNLHFHQLNPNISWGNLTAEIPTAAIPWSNGDGVRCAGVSSFGFCGTNAHVILEEASARKPEKDTGARPLHVLTISAPTQDGLNRLVKSYDEFITNHPNVDPGDLCFSANTGRSHFPHRLGLVASSSPEFREKLTAFDPSNGLDGSLESRTSTPPVVSFLFTGQGAQYAGMGRELYQSQPRFRRTLDRCCEILTPHLDKPLLEVMFADDESDGLLNQTAFTQPALFALEYAIADLWDSWGIKPAFVLGHSVGEYVAASFAGVFSLEDGLKFIAARARLMQELPAAGSMLVVFADRASTQAVIDKHDRNVSIAAVNGPENTVISGRRDEIEVLTTHFSKNGVTTRKLAVSHAFHSPLMEPILNEFHAAASKIEFNQPRLGVISNLTGNLVSSEITTPDYWCRHVREPVQFFDGIKTLANTNSDTFVEIGPKPVLLAMAENCLPRKSIKSLPSMRPGQECRCMFESLAELYVRGAEVDWHAFDRDFSRQSIVTPSYPFAKRRVPRTRVANQQPVVLIGGMSNGARHPFLQQRLVLPGIDDIRFQSRVDQNGFSYLADHIVFDTPVMPGTAYMELAIAVGCEVFETDNVTLQELHIQKALVLAQGETRIIQVVVKTRDDAVADFSVYSMGAGQENGSASWLLHALGSVQNSEAYHAPASLDRAALQDGCPMEVPIDRYYQGFREHGLEYGAYFRGIERLWRSDVDVLGQLRLPDGLDGDDYYLHPALLDSALQILAAALPGTGEGNVYLPVGVENFRIFRSNCTRLWCYGRFLPEAAADSGTLTAELSLFDENGEVIARMDRLNYRQASRQAVLRDLSQDNSDWLFEVEWIPQEAGQQPSFQRTADNKGRWMIFMDESGIGENLAKRIEKSGDGCVFVHSGQSFQREDKHTFQVNPENREDFQRLIAESSGDDSWCQELIFLWITDNRVSAEGGTDDIRRILRRGCGAVLYLVQAILDHQLAQLPRLTVATGSAQPVGTPQSALNASQAALWGLARVIHLEHPMLSCRCIDLGLEGIDDDSRLLFQEVWNPDRENQIAYRYGSRYVARLAPRETPANEQELVIPDGEAYQLKISDYGTLENLQLRPLARRSPGPSEVEIEVSASGLNLRDVLYALGMLEEAAQALGIRSAAEMPFGFECAGRVVAVGAQVSRFQAGDRVIALAVGGLNRFVTVPESMVVSIPANMNFEEAATVPMTYLTAYYGLHVLANIQAGDKILIHAAAGGVGQAAVQLAQRAGALIFATASPKKWPFLKSMGIEHVMNSRALDFSEQVRRITAGEGVDIVLNSLSGDFIEKSFEVLAANGRFLELGKIGTWDADRVREVRPNASYFPYDLGSVAADEPSLVTSMFTTLAAAFDDQSLKPLPFKTFSIVEVPQAFRYMAQAKHIGKIVITHNGIQESRQDSAISPNRGYLITGGLGGLGLKVAAWLVEQGARYLLLTGRSKPSPSAQEVVAELEKAGVRITIIEADISSRDDVVRVLEVAGKNMPDLGGIIHAAGVLDDGIISQQTWERFDQVMAPKVYGAWHLHVLTEKYPLEFFVCFSSTAAVLGSPGQANYAAANAYMDALSHQRRSMGLSGLSINWGPWAEVGMAAALDSRSRRRMASQGLGTIPTDAGLRIMGSLLRQNTGQAVVLPMNWSTFLAKFPAGGEPPLLLTLAGRLRQQTLARQPLAKQEELLTRLHEEPPEDCKVILTSYLQDRLGKVLGIDKSQLDHNTRSLSQLGLDSLMGMELKNRLCAELGVDLSMQQFIEVSDIPGLAALLLEQITMQRVFHGEPSSSEMSEYMEEVIL